LEGCPLLRGLPHFVDSPNHITSEKKEVNRVVYLSSEQEATIAARFQRTGNPTITPTAIYNPSRMVLNFYFCTNYENSNFENFHGPSKQGYLTHLLFPVTVTTPAGPVVSQPIPAQIPRKFHQSFWNNLVEAAKSVGLNKLEIEVIAHMIHSNGIQIPEVEQVLDASLNEYTISFHKKVTPLQNNDDSDGDYMEP
jgi:hypothetical protein